MGIITAVAVLSFLVFFHELGHFLAARAFGVKVEVFSVGFGNKILKKTFGNTEYAISAIPLGGYVKMKGQEDLSPTKTSQDSDSYSTKHPLKKLVILFAGPFANFVIAFVIYAVVAMSAHRFLLPVVGEVSPNSPAAGQLARGDLILKIGREQVKEWKQIGEIISASNGEPLVFTLKRDLKILRLEITPKLLETKTIFGETSRKKLIGIMPSGETAVVRLGLIDALSTALWQTIDASKLIFMSLVKMIEGVVGIENIGGIVSIVDFTAKATDAGLVTLAIFTALISVNLGVLNLLPIPALDGGHMIFTLYELIFRRLPSERILYALTVFGWSLLFGLMLLGLYNDLNRLVFK